MLSMMDLEGRRHSLCWTIGSGKQLRKERPGVLPQ
jgi:hypothetical protein